MMAAQNTPVNASSRSQRIVRLAKRQLGRPYIWGATGPYGFDCSGLAQYVYRRAAGISLPRRTFDQVNVGRRVSLSRLRAGDLLFWYSRWEGYYHVAIYIGHHYYIQAPEPGQRVKRTKLSWWYPSAALRVI
ncbi:MAG: C40 family peptidase [Lactobacillus sp.]|nr:C40 family peptidase [Lactobacillus sp.]MDN6042956.1 C40 family peptidase [Lactobacillus sp.]MDN6052744.1 C40 family peptidase [Lactobacillus sp.]